MRGSGGGVGSRYSVVVVVVVVQTAFELVEGCGGRATGASITSDVYDSVHLCYNNVCTGDLELERL